MAKQLIQTLFTLLLFVGAPSMAGAQNSAVQDSPEESSEQEMQILTLFEAIEYAKENSLQARMAQYTLIASRWSYRVYRADLLPSLSLSGNAPSFNSRFQDVLRPDGDIVQVYTQQSSAQANLEVGQQIAATGGRVGVTTGLRRLGIFESENNYQWTSTPVSIFYSQPINAFNGLKWQTRLQPLQLELAEKNYVEAIETLSRNVTGNYFQVLNAKSNLQTAEFNVASNDSIYTITQGRFRVGSIAEDQLLQADYNLRNAQLTLNQSQLAYEQVLRQFRLTLGLDMDANVDVEEPNVIPDIQVEPDLAMEMALMNNSQSLNFEIDAITAERNLQQAIKSSAFSPTITAQFGLTKQSEDFGEIYSDPLRSQGFNISFDLPIFNWGRQRAIINQQRNSFQRTADNIAFQRQQFILDVQSTVNEFLQLPSQLETAELSLAIARQRYEVTLNRYGIASVSLTDLQNAQVDLEEARQRYLQAIGAYWQGVYELRSLTLYDFEEGRLIDHELSIDN